MNTSPGTLQFPNSLLTLRKEGIIRFMMEERFVISQVADPFCPELRQVVSNHLNKMEYTYHKKATYVCIEGPRFSTRAESQFFRDVMKADIIGMTLVPECPSLAREAEICYVSIATVTDYDVCGPFTSKF